MCCNPKAIDVKDCIPLQEKTFKKKKKRIGFSFLTEINKSLDKIHDYTVLMTLGSG